MLCRYCCVIVVDVITDQNSSSCATNQHQPQCMRVSSSCPRKNSDGGAHSYCINMLVMYLAARCRVSRGCQRPKRERVKLINIAGARMWQPVNGSWEYPFSGACEPRAHQEALGTPNGRNFNMNCHHSRPANLSRRIEGVIVNLLCNTERRRGLGSAASPWDRQTGAP